MIWLLLIIFIPGGLLLDEDFYTIGSASSLIPICDSHKIIIKFEAPLKIQNQYTLRIPILAETHVLILKFDSAVALELRNPIKTEISVEKLATPRNSYRFTFNGDHVDFNFDVQVFGPASGTIPYVESVLRDYYEICRNPPAGYLDHRVNGTNYEENFSHIVDRSCGRRKVTHTQLIVHGQSTGPGDWPWHVAILRLEKFLPKYICGGTLLTKTLVLTAAHCASTRGNAVIPDILSVHLGKHHLIGGDIGAQEREVFRVIIHRNFDGFTLDNDIALLKLKSEATITDHVQPACLWNKKDTNKLPNSQSIFGTVVGWGFSRVTVCVVKYRGDFGHSSLCSCNRWPYYSTKCFKCTSVCNGDSGGGLMIFVPDSSGDTNTAAGGWYVRGIVSIALRRSDALICDPYQYTIFTDVEKYRDWLLEYLE